MQQDSVDTRKQMLQQQGKPNPGNASLYYRHHTEAYMQGALTGFMHVWSICLFISYLQAVQVHASTNPCRIAWVQPQQEGNKRKWRMQPGNTEDKYEDQQTKTHHRMNMHNVTCVVCDGISWFGNNRCERLPNAAWCTHAVILFSNLHAIFVGLFDPEKIFIDNENEQLTFRRKQKHCTKHREQYFTTKQHAQPTSARDQWCRFQR